MTAVVDLRVEQIVLEAGAVRLSALLSEAQGGSPRAVVVALHGAGMRAGYFNGEAGRSLLTLGSALGFTVLALDRGGYGLSAESLPDGLRLADQAAVVRAALDGFANRYDTGAALFVLGHSYGGKVALALATVHLGLAGLDVSGLSHRYAVDIDRLDSFHGRQTARLHWGPPALYPPGTFTSAASLLAPVPRREEREARRWPEIFPGLAPRVRCPVRFTFADHERWWRHDRECVADLAGALTAVDVVVDRLRHAGHNISLGWAARAYHLRALAFFEDCLTARGR
jgi:pimeloyl-ACP methyl ester carboxylesterase